MSEHTPFDIDPHEKQVQWRRPVILIGLAGLVVAGLATAYVVWEYSRARLAGGGPLLQAQADGTLLAVWRPVGGVKGRDYRVVLNLADGAEGVVEETVTIEPQVQGGLYVAELPDVRPYRDVSYWVEANLRLTDRAVGPWPIQSVRMGQRFRFAVFGESRDNRLRYDVAQTILRTVPHLVLHMGDLLATPDWRNVERNLYEPYGVLMNIRPFMPVVGMGKPDRTELEVYRKAFVLPENGPDVGQPTLSYWFDYATARFVIVDAAVSDEALEQAVTPWLREVLADAPAGWKFVFIHPPPYTGCEEVEADLRVRRVLVPVFEEAGVDVVFSGMSQLYERTLPLRGGQPVEPGQGVVYVVTGAAGRARHKESRPPPPFVAAFNDDVLSFTVVELAGNLLTLRQVSSGGETIDEWSFRRQAPPLGAEAQPQAERTTE